MVIEADFVPTAITNTALKPVTDYNEFAFPTIGKSSPATVLAGGDVVVTFKSNPATQALVKYLATPGAATIWAKRGGYTSANKNVKPNAYGDVLNRKTAIALALAKVTRFDMSDQQPAAFGSTVGQGEWKIFQDLVQNPKNVNAVAAALEASAKGIRRLVSDAGAIASSPPIDGELGKDPGRWRDYLVAAGFLAPALILLGVWIVYPALRTAGRSFFNADGSEFVWFDNYKSIFTSDFIVTAIKNNAIWIGVVPTRDRDRAGLRGARRAVRWSVSFKLIVFMPMAISLFAAGLIWRIMDQKSARSRRRQCSDRGRARC